ncbi:heme exporter protein CcmD [Endozoicomonas sp. OPT23]|uniref:heme exporter protein CcmD n=1 Tax=Endozoicomonas sp. OPT23 TaxID=2072845 RepID=UPI00129A7DC0|nr:heme exporter protein CcmD [Endozoicomonas sp. OPT23]MRI32422.1 heme exporter protein CcmD [Endozoicomonas sp. OPT23]
MYFENFASLVDMGGHGIYVWPTYALGLLVILYNIVSPMMARKKIVTQIRRQAKAANNRKKPASSDTGRKVNSHEQFSANGQQQASTTESSRTVNEGE